MKKDLLICVSTFNRMRVAELSIENLRYCTSYADIWLYDDASTEGHVRQRLGNNVDRLYLNTENQGIDQLRVRQLRDFVGSSFGHLYLTDSDVIHDPNFMTMLTGMRELEPRKIVSLYSSSQYQGTSSGPYGIRRHSGGVSHLYTREQAELIVSKLDDSPVTCWDYLFPKLAETNFAYTRTSHLEHFGAGGLHSGAWNWLHDRALHPTPFLQEVRAPVINYLNRAGPRPDLSDYYNKYSRS